MAVPIGEAVSALKSKFTPEVNELTRWRRTFDKYAVDKDGVKYLDQAAFVEAIVPQDNSSKIRKEQYGVLFRVADTSNRGLVSFEEFQVFESLLKRPDADHKIAFQYFDVDGSGSISFEEFKAVFSSNIGTDAIPFNFDSDWVKLYIGKKNVIGYVEFTQMMKGLQGERLRQAFRYFDKDQSGFISPKEFQRIIIEIARHKLSDSVLNRLPTLCLLSAGQKISYSEVVAFLNIVREMDSVERVIKDAVSKSKDGRIDMDDFLNQSSSESHYNHFTPLEASMVFHFASRGKGSTSRLVLNDFRALLDEKWMPPHALEPLSGPEATMSAFHTVASKIYGFFLGGIGGGAGAFVVYPIDMVKTRLQNQRSTVVGEVLYKNWLDCVKKIFRNEGGIPGFYKGLLPQLIGVAPEKAIKLTINDLIRKRMADPETGRIPLWAEIMAGGTAGGCQVIVTNPLEITKIRLQMQGEAMKETGAVKRGAMHVVRQLGLVGLYKGAGACLLRDVPFSMIYFTSYAHLRKDFFGEGKNGYQLTNFQTLLAAGAGGIPAAYLTTPADVVKTRLQTEAKAGQTHYKGLFNAFSVITKEEGIKALFKGGVPRMIRSSPQFAVTLVVYEWLKVHFPYPYGADKTTAPLPRFLAAPDDITRVRARNALKILLDCHEDFGRSTLQPTGGTGVLAGKPLPRVAKVLA